MAAADNHTLAVEIERLRKIFEWRDGVNGADPLTIIHPVTLSISVPSFYNVIVNKTLNSCKGSCSPLKPSQCSEKRVARSINILLLSVFSTFTL